MSDLSEQQVVMADASAGGRESVEEARRSQARELARELLSAVSEEDRILLTLKEVEGLSLKELREVYKIGENALKVRLFRARQRVLKAFDAFVSEDYRNDFTRLWEKFDVLRGQRIGVLFRDERILGTADGIDATGALRLRDDKGALHRCLAGDVTIEKTPA